MNPRIFHVEHGRYSWWLIADGCGVMSSLIGEPRSVLIARWESVYGRPPGGYEDVPESIAARQIGTALAMLTAYPLPPARPLAEGGAR